MELNVEDHDDSPDQVKTCAIAFVICSLVAKSSPPCLIERRLDLFRDACGLSAPLTLEVRDTNGASGRRSRPAVRSAVRACGTDPRADVVLEDPQVSRRHAYFQAVGGRVLCIDLHSRTRLRWEGEEGRRDRGWLAPGHDVWIGPFALHWTGAGSSASLESISPAFSVSPAHPRDSPPRNRARCPARPWHCPPKATRRDRSGSSIPSSGSWAVPSNATSCWAMKASRGFTLR